ncbi:hypothetical protein LA080_006236 [Diaporthe eres]|nr:hypothetical protein LA080_006236 [Diaporthe eres]
MFCIAWKAGAETGWKLIDHSCTLMRGSRFCSCLKIATRHGYAVRGTNSKEERERYGVWDAVGSVQYIERFFPDRWSEKVLCHPNLGAICTTKLQEILAAPPPHAVDVSCFSNSAVPRPSSSSVLRPQAGAQAVVDAVPRLLKVVFQLVKVI